MYEAQFQYTKEQGNQNRFLGKAGEHRVLSELLLRGINAGFLEIDNGVDLVLENGFRIQIKSSHSDISTTRGYKYPVYLFPLRKKKYINSKGVTLRPKIKTDSIDFLILWCVDDDWFYIIPSDKIVQTTVNIPIAPEKPSKYQQYLNAWGLLKGGTSDSN
jgi:hypothetical protein